MDKKAKVTVIGAGSAAFGLSTLVGILRHPDLQGVELFLHDIDENGLEKIRKLAEKMNEAWGSGVKINSSVERGKALEGADFVILSIAIDREKCWKLD